MPSYISAAIVSWLLAWVMVLVSHTVSADTTYLTVEGESTREFKAEVWLSSTTVEQQFSLDTNQDNIVSPAELRARATMLHQLVSQQVSMRSGNIACAYSMQSPGLAQRDGRLFIRQPFTVGCRQPGPLAVSYPALQKHDKVLAQTTFDGQAASFTLKHARSTFVVNSPANLMWIQQEINFIQQGLLHVWAGPQQLIFFIVALLTLNLSRHGIRWKPGLQPASLVWRALVITLAFTAAHGAVLTMISAGWQPAPGHWLSVAIALSVILVAANNIWPVLKYNAMLAFALGLLHAISFVQHSVGVSSSFSSNTLPVLFNILAFCLGLVAGLLVICALLIPMLLLLGNNRWYARWMMPTCSAVLALIAVGLAYTQW